jgi:cytochrome c biogenesis protein CcmG/thiol:disulfide interchange protein DsbE
VKSWRFLVPGALFLVLVGFFVVGLKRDPSYIPSPLLDKPAPHFALASLQDPAQQVDLRSYAGKPYLLNVWGTWCGGCRQEHPVLLDMQRTGLVPIIGLNWKDDRSLAVRWLAELGDPYAAVAFDPEGKAAIDWGVYGAPETFLVGADGKVLHKQVGAMTLEIWTRDFVPKLRGEGTR